MGTGACRKRCDRHPDAGDQLIQVFPERDGNVVHRLVDGGNVEELLHVPAGFAEPGDERRFVGGRGVLHALEPLRGAQCQQFVDLRLHFHVSLLPCCT